MYFHGSVEVDPSQITNIKRIQPKKMFAKLLSAITFGHSNDKVEQETFTAIAILQQINMAMRSIGITNVVRLSINNYDFYLDTKGVDDDMDRAMLETETKIDPMESEVFETVVLVLEHSRDNLKYLIEVEILKDHKVGEYPIKLTINGLLAELKKKPHETKQDLENRMKSIFANQESYEEYIRTKESLFNNFVDELSMALRKFIQVDGLHTSSSTKMIRPKEQVNSEKDIRYQDRGEPIYSNYFGVSDFFFYSWLWSSMAWHHNIYVHDTYIVDDTGNDVMHVGEEGFNASEGDTLNPDADFAPPENGDIDYFEGSEYQSELDSANAFDTMEGGDFGGDSSGWLDGGGDFGDAGGCSSCGGCSGCGGCGGCS